MKKRNPLAVVVLSIITLGIYDLYWLVKTKKVLNEKTKYHTPTIFLLIAPFLILLAGYIVIIVSAVNSDNSVTYSSNSSNSTVSGSGEQLNTQGQRRPSQYIHLCQTSGGIDYVTQGSPKCLGNDEFLYDYATSVPGTVYSTPCETSGSPTRYVYINNSTSCPDNTSLVFTNSLANNSVGVSKTNVIGFILVGIGAFASFVISIIWFFKFAKAVNEYTQGKMSTAVTFLILWLIHLIGVALIQDTFNDMEDNPLQDSGPGQPLPVQTVNSQAIVSTTAPMPTEPTAPPSPAQQTPPIVDIQPLPTNQHQHNHHHHEHGDDHQEPSSPPSDIN